MLIPLEKNCDNRPHDGVVHEDVADVVDHQPADLSKVVSHRPVREAARQQRKLLKSVLPELV